MEYKPSLLFRNGHFNTIFASYLRNTSDIKFTRKRLKTPDDDFLDVDLLQNENNRLAILCHGLEGSSKSSYIKGMARTLVKNKWDVAAINYRGCSGEINRQKILYHSGATYDLDFVFNSLAKDYQSVILIGFSLGGNIALKYCGERANKIDPRIKAVIACSVPVDLGAASKHIGYRSNYIYEKRFLISLKNKIKLKNQQYPDVFDVGSLDKAISLYLFDDIFTGPIHGFTNAEDYYSKSSSLQFIPYISIPGLIINALDDPILPDECYPYTEVQSNQKITLLTPRYGGHVGFVRPGRKMYWNEIMSINFIDSL